MEHKDRIYFAVAVGLIAYGGSWLAAGVLHQPLWWYEPLGHSWHFQTESPGPVAMDWYGRVLQGLAAGLLSGGAGWAIAGRFRFSADSSWRAVLGGWAAAALLLCMFLYAFTLSQRTVFPPTPLQLSSPGSRP